jgi:hypothetical protein
MFAIVATQAGEWQWISGSNQSDDNELNNKSGSFTLLNGLKKRRRKIRTDMVLYKLHQTDTHFNMPTALPIL